MFGQSTATIYSKLETQHREQWGGDVTVEFLETGLYQLHWRISVWSCWRIFFKSPSCCMAEERLDGKYCSLLTGEAFTASCLFRLLYPHPHPTKVSPSHVVKMYQTHNSNDLHPAVAFFWQFLGKILNANIPKVQKDILEGLGWVVLPLCSIPSIMFGKLVSF